MTAWTRLDKRYHITTPALDLENFNDRPCQFSQVFQHIFVKKIKNFRSFGLREYLYEKYDGAKYDQLKVELDPHGVL